MDTLDSVARFFLLLKRLPVYGTSTRPLTNRLKRFFSFRLLILRIVGWGGVDQYFQIVLDVDAISYFVLPDCSFTVGERHSKFTLGVRILLVSALSTTIGTRTRTYSTVFNYNF